MATSKQRKIIHVDFDAFFASIEISDNPSLQGKPVAVGGTPQNRGVISTCNYEARNYGIRSAMPSSLAMKLCPKLYLLPSRMNRYKEVSNHAQTIFHKYTSLVEPLSLDEAYLDVTHTDLCQGSATLIAKNICKEITQTLNLTASAGVAPNMFLAKIASDWNKPNGIFVITPDDVATFIETLPITKLHGVGKVTAQKMHAQNIMTCGHLKKLSLSIITRQFGSFGTKLWHLCRGIDDREVIPNRIRKSISVEKTFSQDLQTKDAIIKQLIQLYLKLTTRIHELRNHYLPTKRFIKIKFADYTTVQTIENINHLLAYEHFTKLTMSLLGDNFTAIRLIGIGVKVIYLSELSSKQLTINF